jgi:hypothetical protein
MDRSMFRLASIEKLTLARAGRRGVHRLSADDERELANPERPELEHAAARSCPEAARPL